MTCKHQEGFDWAVCGFSCKDFSKYANNSSSSRQGLLNQQTSAGASATTYHGLLNWVDNNHPDAVFVENTDAMSDGEGPSFALRPIFDLL